MAASCPFCGWPAMAMREGSNGPWAVYCNNDGTCGDDVTACGAKGPERSTEAEAIAAWDARQPQSPDTSLTDEMIEAGVDQLVHRMGKWPGDNDADVAKAIYLAMKSKEQSK